MVRDLGDGLVLRRATAADADAVAGLCADVLRHQDAPEPEPSMRVWARDLIAGRHPTFRPGDACLVEDRRQGAIVSVAHLIPHTWTYAGIPMRVGQPEMIGTRAAYRGRGLVRALLAALHASAAERGHQVLAINGIPWFYRQFGYEYALEQMAGRVAHPPDWGPLDAERAAAWRVRPAGDGDVAFLTATQRAADARYLVTCPRTEDLWRYELSGRSGGNPVRREVRIVEDGEGTPIGFLAHTGRLWGRRLGVFAYEVRPGASWRAPWPAVLAYLIATGEAYAAADGKLRLGALFFALASRHPLYDAATFAETESGYAYYVRVPDVPAFLLHVAPALERRLAESPLAGHTGELRLGFYGAGGVRLEFDAGRLRASEAWRPPLTLAGIERAWPTSEPERPAAAFPGLTFLQLLFGYRSLDELAGALPDLFVRTAEARALLRALFPKQPSSLWPVL